MTMTRSESDAHPAGEAVSDALWVQAFAQILGAARGEPFGLDRAALVRAIQTLSDRGVARGILAEVEGMPTPEEAPERWGRLLARVREAAETCPLPEAEWDPVTAILDEELLSELVGASPSSLRRYRSGERPTPPPVADRLHLLALILTDLAGSYNDYGMRRWFDRRRTALGGRSPRDVLSEEPDPDSDAARAVRALSSALVGAGAT